MSDPRITRMRRAVDRRLSWVRCAVEGVYHRHNISAILRTCDAMGLMDAHLVQGHFTPSQGPSKGAERWLNLHHHKSAAEAIEAIRGAGYAIYVADLATDAYTPATLPLDRPVCLWFGAELQGVCAQALEAAEGVVTVPMRGLAQSLNVSVAAALTLHTVAERARLELGERALLDEATRQATWARWVAREEEMGRGLRVRSWQEGGEPS